MSSATPLVSAALLLSTAVCPQQTGPRSPDRLAAHALRTQLDARSPYRSARWRPIGPRFCGGRIESIAVAPDDPQRIYVAPGSGNLFRSDDGGTDWRPLFEHEATGSIGCVTIAPSDSNVLWLGTGEAHMGGMSYDGCGVYRSVDQGETWTHAGLQHALRIAKIQVHPHRPDSAWVTATKTHGDQTGIWFTDDAGKTWTRQLAFAQHVRAIDLIAQPVASGREGKLRLFAASWGSGRSDGSGIYRSNDSGKTWTRLNDDDTRGLPRGEFLERVAVHACPSRPDHVYALFVDERKPGDGRYGVGGVVYRSTDGGDRWQRCHEDYLPTYVGWDFCDIIVSPKDPDRVYVCGRELLISDDGGTTWRKTGEKIERLLPFEDQLPSGDDVLHLDMHDLWIDPADPARLILGNDGGLYESRDGGESWLHRNTLPIAEFYTVHADDQPIETAPYRLWGGTQDNASVVGPPTPIDPGGPDPYRHVFLDRWNGGDGFATLPDPTDDRVVYFEHQNGDMRRKRMNGSIQSGKADLRIRPPGRKLQFAWNTPLRISAHDPKRLYTAAQFVFRSDAQGIAWRKISPDLGRGGALQDLQESTLVDGLLYTIALGGRVHVTSDGGKSWQPAGKLPQRAKGRVFASRHSVDRAYVCLRSRRNEAFAFRSDDRGKTWTPIHDGLPPESVNVLCEDPRDQDVLYAGTDHGVCVTTDGGKTWASLSSTLPNAPVMDLAFQGKHDHLIAATHGRSLWLLDAGAIIPR